MDLGIRGRTAIVNGGSAGMGKSSAMALAREGVDLVVSARGEARLLGVCEAIARETGVTVIPVVADHSTDEGREKILAACPSPDILVGTCAPPRIDGDPRKATRQQWLDTLSVTLLSPIAFMSAVMDGMMERRWGRIVNIATAAAKFPTFPRVISGTPRAALVNYTVGIAKQAARHNVVINNILPGMFHTASTLKTYSALAEENNSSYEEEISKAVGKLRIPVGDFGNPDDLGATVAFFCSQFANYTVGQSLVIDGGLTTSTF
jgi:3-oxoacyl-[acyl-carrier protein] reductase